MKSSSLVLPLVILITSSFLYQCGNSASTPSATIVRDTVFVDKYRVDTVLKVIHEPCPLTMTSKYTFAEYTPVYAEANFEAEVLDSLPFNTQVMAEVPTKNPSMIYDELFPDDWARVQWNNQEGYIRSGQLAIKDWAYQGVLLGEHPTESSSLQFRSFNSENRHQIQDSINFYRSSEFTCVLKEFYRPTQGTHLFQYSHYRTGSCPYIETHNWVVLNRAKKFSLLTTSSAEGEAGYEHQEDLYVPVQLQDIEKDTTLLVKNGNLNSIFNTYTGKLQYLAIPPDFEADPRTLFAKVVRDVNPDRQPNPVNIEPPTYYVLEGDSLRIIELPAHN